MDLYKKTYDILKELPFWFKLKKDYSNCKGTSFINITGKEFTFIDSLLDYAYKQCYINTVDLHYPDIIYKVILPVIYKSNCIVKVYSDSGVNVQIKDNVTDFLGINQTSMYYATANPYDYCYIDYENNIIYFRNCYDTSNTNEYGKINIQFKDGSINTYKMKIHNVWNALDDFGYLLNEKRYKWEKNQYYINRIKDVFENIANSSKYGLLNGIARDLYLRHNETWEDGSEDYIIKNPMIVLNRIKIDDVIIPLDNVLITQENYILLKGNPDYKNTKRKVSYVSGIEMHQLFNKNDTKLMNELYNPDKTATELLKYYAKVIQRLIPNTWNNFVWDESCWNTSDMDVGSQGYIPNVIDAKIEGFKKYNAG